MTKVRVTYVLEDPPDPRYPLDVIVENEFLNSDKMAALDLLNNQVDKDPNSLTVKMELVDGPAEDHSGTVHTSGSVGPG